MLGESIMVGFKVKYYWYQIGSGDFLFSFFSTVAYHLENQKWGRNISSDITNLSNYFVTSDGEDFITIFNRALEKAEELSSRLEITNI